MASLGKCHSCNKTTYQLEGVRVGPPGKEMIFHKLCFKCQNEGCGWQLTLGSYKFCDGKVWCANHCPMKGFSNKAHQKGNIDSSAVAVDHALKTPKLNTVNEQIRGTNEAGNFGLDSMGIKNALNAPKLDVVNEQVRLNQNNN